MKGFCTNDGRIVLSPLWEGTLHEVGHKIGRHRGDDYNSAIVMYEREAWEYVLGLPCATIYSVMFAWHCLQTYIEYNKRRSLCPCCGNRGEEYAPDTYVCPGCNCDY